MFFNKSRPLFLAIICFFTAQTGVLTAALDSSVGTGLWATLVASMNNLMPSLSSLMANIAEKINSFLTSSSSSEYKGYAAAAGGALATIVGYKVLDLVPKRAKELEKELFKDYVATYSTVEQFMFKCGQETPDEKCMEHAQFIGILKDMQIIKDASEKKDGKYGFVDKKALESLLKQREERLIKLPYTQALSLEKNSKNYEGISFETFTRNRVVANGIDAWVINSEWIFGKDPEDRLKGLEWLRSRPIFSGKDDKSGLGATIELWNKKKAEKEQEGKTILP